MIASSMSFFARSRENAGSSAGGSTVGSAVGVGVAAVVPHHALADSLMDEISQFAETATDAQLLEESLEIR